MKASLRRLAVFGTSFFALGVVSASAEADGWGGYYEGPPAVYYPSQWGQPGPTVQPLPGPVVRPLPGPVIGPSLQGQGGTVIIYGDPYRRGPPPAHGRPLRQEGPFGQQPLAEDHSYRSQRFGFDPAYGEQRPIVPDRPVPRQSFGFDRYEGQRPPTVDPSYGYQGHGYDRGVAVPVVPSPNPPVWVPNSGPPVYYGY